jgi:lipopolysaccharide/colanic/teichoic acid biosynthesis glycosyltransferase
VTGRGKRCLPMVSKINLAVKGVNGIRSIEEFKAIVKQERARSERDGSEFSIVAFQLDQFLDNGRALSQIVRALKKRGRTIDEIGWFDERCICALLPCTDHDGANKFALDYEEMLVSVRPPPPFSVYTYPAQWRESSNGEKNKSNIDSLEERLSFIFVYSVPKWKRGLDITGSIVLLLLFSPLFLITTLYIKMVSRGPVFFCQKRVGYRGRTFTFLKLRTMKIDTSAHNHKRYLKELINSDKPMVKLDSKKDSRIIFGGKIIRKACIDELPQLINVLRGEMSLVGPRPCIPYEAEEYLRWHTNRFNLLPGCTGLWQVSGKNRLTFKQMVRLDIAYAKNMSFWNDIKILLRTAPAVLDYMLEAVFRKLQPSKEQGTAKSAIYPLKPVKY